MSTEKSNCRPIGTFKIGGYGFGPWTFPEQVDEVSLYNRALSSAEIQSIYQAGSAGKCFSPSITLQPQGQVGYWGASATFNVHANGSAPLGYLWYKDGFAIIWATNSSLVLTNLSLDEGGNYYVVVTNAYGSATSSNALLTVNPAGVSLGTYPGLTVQGTPSPGSVRGLTPMTMRAEPYDHDLDSQQASAPRSPRIYIDIHPYSHILQPS